MIDPNNPVVALCAAGVAVEGDREQAQRTLTFLPVGGYRDFVDRGIRGLCERIATTEQVTRLEVWT